MNKFVSFLIVLLAIAVATPVLAEDRLSLSGQMRVRGIYLDNQSNFNNDVNTNASDAKFFDQRLRVAGKISIAEGVNVQFRSDMSSGTWGVNLPNNVALQRAFIEVDKGMFNLKAGRQFYGLGNLIAVNIDPAAGFVLAMKGAVPVEFGYFKITERTDLLADDNDLDAYTLAVRHKTDMYNAVVFGGLTRDGQDPQERVYLVGMQTSMKLDPINLNFEVNYLSGKEQMGAKNETRGINAYLDVNTAVAENVTVGGAFLYAKGYKATDSKSQQQNLTGADFQPQEYSFMAAAGAGFNLYPGIAVDPTGNGTGVIGGMGYGQFKVMDDLTLRASAGYWKPEVDDVVYKDFITMTGSARYALAARTWLDNTVFYTIPSTRDNAPDDNGLGLAFSLNVNF